MLVKVDQETINEASRLVFQDGENVCENCLLALAISKAIGEKVSVSVIFEKNGWVPIVRLLDKEGNYNNFWNPILLPIYLEQVMWDFDDEREIEPFEFEFNYAKGT